jgi:hypothetical protein
MVCEQATKEERARAVSLLRLPIVLYSPSIRRKRPENVMSSVMCMDYPPRQGAKRPIPFLAPPAAAKWGKESGLRTRQEAWQGLGPPLHIYILPSLCLASCYAGYRSNYSGLFSLAPPSAAG